MFTEAQLDYLKRFADKGLAEEAEIAARNNEVEQNTKIMKAREEKEVELKNQAEQLIKDGLQHFDEIIAPTIE